MKQGWEIKKLGEVCEMYQPKTISTKEMVDDGQYPVFGANGIIGKYDKYNHEEPQLLITCRGATCGSVNISEPKSWINGNAMVVRPKDHTIDLKFLEYLFRGGVDLSRTITGAAQPQITRQSLNPIEISYPKSLHEQQRIVSILDETFSAIDKAKANVEQNLKNAKELFESVLNSLIIDDGKLKMEKLGDVCEIKGRIGYRGYTVQDLVQKGEGAITLSPSNIQDNKFITDKCTYISWFKYEESPEIMVFEGDILFVKTGSTYGKVALVENLPEKATINPQFVVLKDIKCSNRFLYYALTTKAFKEKVENIVGGAATPTLSQKNLAEQTIPLPPFEEQQTIVRQLDALRAETQKLEAVYQKKIDDLEELKKSILQKAFAGELRGGEPIELKTEKKLNILK